MKKAEVKEGHTVLVPMRTYERMVIVSQDGPYRTWVRDERGNTRRARTIDLIPIATKEEVGV